MAALSCDICGGKLMAKAGGIFECDSCGMQYDKTRIQEMVQEIKGTVKVEGTVEVQGTVKVDGPVKVEGGVNIDSLLKRGWLALEDEKWKDAAKHFDDALNYNAECGEAYLGKLMADLKVHRREEVGSQKRMLKNEGNYRKALRFANEELKAELAEYNDAVTAWMQKLAEYRARIAPVRDWISAGDGYTVGLKSDGTVVTVGDYNDGQCGVSDWKLFNSLDTLEQEREDARKRTEEERIAAEKRAEEEWIAAQIAATKCAEEEKKRRKTALEQEKSALQTELANLKGLFTGKRRKEIETELKGL